MARAKSNLPTKPTVVIDSREKPENRLFEVSNKADKDFRSFVVDKIDAGDYTVSNVPNLVIIEKKQTGHELWSNVVINRERWLRQVERMRQFEHKYILIQQSYDEFVNPANWKGIPYARRFQAMAVVESWLISMSQTENIHYIFAEKQHAPRIARKILAKTYEWHRKKLMRKDQKEAADEE